jgi:hypothetical protein
MKMSQEEKRKRLLARAEHVVDEYIAWEETHPRPDLTQIEDITLKLRKELGKEIAQMAVEEQEGRTVVPGPVCPKCGKEMRYKGEKKVEVESRAGGLKVKRGYYTCPGCKESFFPPG